MKYLGSLFLTFFVVTLFTSTISAKKDSTTPSSARQSSVDCNKRLPMSALECCDMPTFMNEVIITGCRATVWQNLTAAGKARNASFDGPPKEFYDCMVKTTDMATTKKGVSTIDDTKALNYLKAQLNETTKTDWTKPVTEGHSKCYRQYKTDKNNKVFLDCLIREFYVKCPKFSKTGDCPTHQNHVRTCNELKLEYPKQRNFQGTRNPSGGPGGPRRFTRSTPAN